MSATATLDGVPCTRALVQAPAWGAWWADLDLSEPHVIAPRARVTISIAGRTFAGTVVSGGVHDGRASYHVVGGAGGWGTELAPKAYRDDAGVKISGVISDAARECGETLEGLPATRVGSHYARTRGAASRVLHELAPRSWYIDFDGVTKFGARAPVAYTGDGTIKRRDPAGRVLEIVTDSIDGLAPGVTVEGSLPATDVEYSVDAKRIVVRVYSSARTTRRLDAYARLFDAIFPGARFRGVFEFRVVTQTGERLNLQPVRASSGMPDLAGVPVRPGMAGLKAQVMLGSLVLVAFVDADPSRPAVIAHDAPDSPGWMPLSLELGEGALGVARVTDPVIAGPFGGTVVGASARIKAGF